MKDYEKQQIATLPPQYRPLGAWTYFLYTILFAIPVVGLIFLIIFAVDDSNINRRSFARSFFCSLILSLAVTAILIAIFGFSGLTAYFARLF